MTGNAYPTNQGAAQVPPSRRSKWAIVVAAVALPLILVSILVVTLNAWLDARPEWLLSARNSPEGVIVEVHKEDDQQPTFRSLLEGRTVSRDFTRVRRADLPPDLGTTIFWDDTVKPGRWTLMIGTTKVDIMERALIVDDREEILPAR